MKRGYMAIIATPLCVIAFVLFTAAILTSSALLGNLGALFGGTGILLWIGIGLSSIEEGPIDWPSRGHRVRLSRADRARVKARQREVALDLAIEQAERDAVAAHHAMLRARGES